MACSRNSCDGTIRAPARIEQRTYEPNACWSSLQIELLVPVEPCVCSELTLLTPFCNNKSFIYSLFFELQLRSLFPFQFLDNKPFSFAFRADTQVYFLSLLFCDSHTISMKPFITEITCNHETSFVGSITYAVFRLLQ